MKQCISEYLVELFLMFPFMLLRVSMLLLINPWGIYGV
jgi:hypothetical protein